MAFVTIKIWQILKGPIFFLLSISCNLLNTEVKVKSKVVVWVRMVVSWLFTHVISVADWDLPSITGNWGCVSLAWKETKTQDVKYGV